MQLGRRGREGGRGREGRALRLRPSVGSVSLTCADTRLGRASARLFGDGGGGGGGGEADGLTDVRLTEERPSDLAAAAGREGYMCPMGRGEGIMPEFCVLLKFDV